MIRGIKKAARTEGYIWSRLEHRKTVHPDNARCSDLSTPPGSK